MSVTVWIILLLGCSSVLADYDLPWMMEDTPMPAVQLKPSKYDIKAQLAKLEKEREQQRPKGPRLVSKHWTRLVVSSGSSFTLGCLVEEAGNTSVTWTRDKEILTVNKYRYTSDERFSPQHEPGARDHGLRVTHLRLNDSGLYHCRLDTEPEQIATVKLVVIDAYSVIFGSSEVSVAKGTTLHLLCMILQVWDIPEYILWYRNGSIIDYSGDHISVKMDERTRSSELQVNNVTFDDAGNYTCDPSNATPAIVTVNIFIDTKNKAGRPQKCDDCVLFIQLGATFAFFTISFIIAFCYHSHDTIRFDCNNHDLSDDMYLPPDYYDKSS